MKPATTAQQRIVDADHPWLGLESFTEATQKYFFGRDSEIADIFVRTRENPLTILYGQSGLGKTSLLGAGLIPKLKLEGFRPVLLRLRYEKTDSPLIEQVKYAFADSLIPRTGEHAVLGTDRAFAMVYQTSRFRKHASIWEYFHHIDSRDASFAEHPPILIFDQFEEAFTLGQRAERLDEVRALFTELADVIENRPPAALKQRFTEDRRLVRDYDLSPSPLRIVITLREDYLSHLEAWKRTLPSLMRNRMALHLLSGPQALDAVFKPGHMQGRHLVDEDTAARIVRFVANRRPDVPLAEIGAVPPLLSLVCDELNTQRIEQKKDRITAERVSTGLADQNDAEDDLVARSRIILAQFYQRSFAGFPVGVQHFVEDRMVTVAGHRCPVSRDDAISAFAKCRVKDPGETLQALVSRRLISTEERGGVPWFEITHDVLVPIVKESKDKRLARQRLRRMLLATIGMLSLLGVFVGIAAWAVQKEAEADAQRQQAVVEREKAQFEKNNALESEKRARSQELIAEGARKETQEKLDLLEKANREVARSRVREEEILLTASNLQLQQVLMNAFEEDKRPASFAYLRSALELYPKNAFGLLMGASLTIGPTSYDIGLPHSLVTVKGDIQNLVFSPDSRFLAVCLEERKCQIVDVESGEVVHGYTVDSVSGPQSVQWTRFSPDSTRLVMAVPNAPLAPPAIQPATEPKRPYTLAVVDIDTGATLTQFQTVDAISDLSFSPDGRYLVIAIGSEIQWIDSTTGKKNRSFTFDSMITSVSVSPDGAWIAASFEDDETALVPLEANVKRRRTSYFGVRTTAFSPDGSMLALLDSVEQSRYAARTFERGLR